MECLKIPLLVVVLICVASSQSDGYPLERFRFLAGIGRKSKAIDQNSPSPSPGPAANSDFGNTQSSVNGKEIKICDNVKKCNFRDGSTACVPYVGNGSQATYLLFLNGSSSSHELNIVFHPANTAMNKTISGQDVKVDLQPNMEGNSYITLNFGHESCEILIGASILPGFPNWNMTPTYGAYLFFVAAVCIGGSWACCQLVKRRRHLDVVPYQELEMGQQESDPSFIVDTPEGWDENWDDDWDEEKAVRSPGGRKVLQNGASLKYIDTSEWGNNWDD